MTQSPDSADARLRAEAALTHIYGGEATLLEIDERPVELIPVASSDPSSWHWSVRADNDRGQTVHLTILRTPQGWYTFEVKRPNGYSGELSP